MRAVPERVYAAPQAAELCEEKISAEIFRRWFCLRIALLYHNHRGHFSRSSNGDKPCGEQ